MLAVDQQRAGAAEGVAVLVGVAEQFQPPGDWGGTAIFILAVEAGDEVVNQLGRGCVVAHHDETWRHLDASGLPQVEGLLVMTIQGFKRRLQLNRQAQGVK